MELKWPWMLALAAVVVAALILFSLWRSRRQALADPMLVAHSQRILRLPRFRALARRELLIAEWLTLAVLVTTVGAVLLAARPQHTTVSDESRANRDIVLCLDASSSMFDEDVEVLESYAEIAENLQGERISLVIWSEAAITVFPLTDDAPYIQEQLQDAADAIARQDPQFVLGTYLNERASAIGDGLVSCVDTFDKQDTERGRAIILASDNDPQGKPPVFSLPQASKYAQDHRVRVYGIGSPDLEYNDTARTEFEKAATDTGGTFTMMDDGDSTDEIAADIGELEARRIEQPPRIIVQEAPGTAMAITGIGVLMLLVGWVAGLATRWGSRGGER